MKAGRRADQSYVTTLWAVILNAPIVPLESVRIGKKPGGIHLGVYSREEFEIIERLPLQWEQIARTFFTVWGTIAIILTAVWLVSSTEPVRQWLRRHY
jgi:methyl coenzyme M reductase alpha subunit